MESLGRRSPKRHGRAGAGRLRWRVAGLGAWALGTALLLGCRAGSEPAQGPVDTLILAGYSAPREALEQAVIPAFAARWRAETGHVLRVRSSYLSSGAQARAVLQGFEADVAVLALETDMQKLADGHLLSPTWREETGRQGFVAHTPVVLAVRTGNPQRLTTFADLARPGLEVLTPNPRTSGAAAWNLLGIYGSAALRGGAAAGDSLLQSVLGNVIAMDKGARESIVNFERGIGDVAITYEQEVIGARRVGRRYDEVIPRPTIMADIPAAVVKRYAEAHRQLAAATAFIAFLQAPEGQRLMANFGFRPGPGVSLSPEMAQEYPALNPGDTFSVGDLGGWKTVQRDLVGSKGRLSRMVEEQGAYRPHAARVGKPPRVRGHRKAHDGREERPV